MLQDWFLFGIFSSVNSDRHYQGVKVVPSIIAAYGTESGVPEHAFTDRVEKNMG
jgi:hypothetical protein